MKGLQTARLIMSASLPHPSALEAASQASLCFTSEPIALQIFYLRKRRAHFCGDNRPFAKPKCLLLEAQQQETQQWLLRNFSASPQFTGETLQDSTIRRMARNHTGHTASSLSSAPHHQHQRSSRRHGELLWTTGKAQAWCCRCRTAVCFLITSACLAPVATPPRHTERGGRRGKIAVRKCNWPECLTRHFLFGVWLDTRDTS